MELQIIEKKTAKKNFITYLVISILLLFGSVLFSLSNGNNSNAGGFDNFIFIPIYFGFGLFGIQAFGKLLKSRERGILTWLILLLSLIFLTVIPAAQIGSRVDKVFKHYGIFYQKSNQIY